MGKRGLAKSRILVVTAVTAEKDSALRGLSKDTGDNPSFSVLAGGAGPVAAAVATAKELAENVYDLVISAGIGGGFPGKAEAGSLVVASRIIAADLGVETPDGFSSLQELGFGTNTIDINQDLVGEVVEVLLAAKLPVSVGPVITVSTATGSAARAQELAGRVPGAAAEAMEGYGVALAAQAYGVPILEIRAISNRVGPRDRSAWKMKEALEVLERAFRALREAL